MHHICSILELGSIEGPRSILPNYADVIIESKDIPSWAINICSRMLQRRTFADNKRRWEELQANIIPTWSFYAMPHSLLASMRDGRPERPYWPNPGKERDVIKRAIAILNQAKSGTLPRTWASHAKVDGYVFSPREDAREAKAKNKESKQKNAKKHQEPSRAVDVNKTKNRKASSSIPSLAKPDKGR